MHPRHGRPYPRVETFADVPPPGPFSVNARENDQFDFKGTAAPTQLAEHAKDVASFANTFGGVILLGASLSDGRVTHDGISHAHAQSLVEAYAQAAKDFCEPTPRVDPIPIPLPGAEAERAIVAINIDPSLDLVGARLRKAIDTPWLFPTRAGSHVDFISPKDPRMFASATSRRARILIEMIPEAQRENMVVFHPVRISNIHMGLELQGAIGRMVAVDDDALHFAPSGRGDVRIPLGDVEEVWRDARSRWCVRVSGILRGTGTPAEPDYVPTWRHGGRP